MCGIVGAIGNLDYKTYLTSGLKKLDYRGYDSAGLAFWNKGKISLYRAVGSVENLASIVPDGHAGTAGIAHTRWATHGGVTVENAHPQRSWDKKVYLVHNGVIDNYKELKEWLSGMGCQFRSDTDTEVIASVIAYFIQEGETPLDAIRKAMEKLDGSYALAILFTGQEGLYFAKNKSPLVLGRGDARINCLASDYSPILDYCSNFAALDDGTYGYMTENSIVAYRNGKNLALRFASKDKEDYVYDLAGYPHFMMKEIHEGANVVRKNVETYFDREKKAYLFDPKLLASLKAADEVVFLGCGSSHYSSEAAAAYFNRHGLRATSYIASEWIHGVYPHLKNPYYVLISQSGETADLISCLDMMEKGTKTLGIVNAKDSTIARRSSHVLYIGAGLEVAVASTKSFLGQMALMMLLCGAVNGDTSVPDSLLEAAKAVDDVVARGADIDAIAEGIVEVHDAVLVYEDIAPKQALYLGLAYLAAAALLALPVIVGAGPAPWCIGLVGGLVVLAYSGGKTPLSYLPVGELVSGGVMGGLIPLGVAAAVHGVVDGLALILAIPFIIGIGLVMMTNNISDIEKDRQARRKTLPVIVGRPKAVRLYRAAVVCWIVSLLVIPVWYGGLSGLVVPALTALTGRKVFAFLLTSPLIPQERVRQMKCIAMANVLGNGAYLIGAALAVLAGRAV